MTRVALVRPLRERDFALLFAGMAISLVGDGIYAVALAWLVYDLSDTPSALSLVGLAWSAGMVGFLLLGGVAADRFERRYVMIAADLLRALAIGVMGLLAVFDAVEIWQLAALGFLYGVGEAFFSPAASAIIPQIVGGEDLVQANALQEVARPISLRLAGPALGGLLVGVAGAGTALLVDAASFVVGVVFVALLGARPHPPVPDRPGIRAELRDGLAYTRTQPWLWATLLLAGVTLLFTVGPQQVLLPYVVKELLHLGASSYALVLTVGGVGAILGGLAMSARGMHARAIRTLYVAWGLAVGAIALYGLGEGVALLALGAAIYGAGISAGMVVWATLMQTRVPGRMLGRVSSLDWVVSLGLMPVSFALTGPVSALLGERPTLVAGGALAALSSVAVYALVPGLRADRYSDDERRDVLGESGVGHVGGLHADDLHPVTRR